MDAFLTGVVAGYGITIVYFAAVMVGVLGNLVILAFAIVILVQ